LGNQRLGWIFSAFLIGYAGFQVPAGWLASRFGPRLVITLGVVWWGVATALTTLIPPGIPQAVMLLIGIRFALGAGEAVIYPAANQFVARWVPVQERGFINGLIFAGVGAGSGLTPPLLAWFILRHGWRSAFWFSAVIGVIAGAVWWWAARDTPEEDPKVSPSELAIIHQGIVADAGVKAGQGGGSAPVAISWRAILSRRDLPALIISYFGFGYTAWIFFSWFFLYMAQVRGFNLKASALFSMLPFLSMTIGCLAGGVISDRLTKTYGLRVGRCGLASVAFFFTAIFLVLGSRVQSPQLAGVILAGGAGALYVSQSSFWSVSADIAGRSSGVFSSMVNMGAQVGGAVTASLTPWVAQRFGWTTSFAIAAALAVVGALLWMTVHPERPLSV
jgi:MFS transporter, ACS family, glucarate transporter